MLIKAMFYLKAHFKSVKIFDVRVCVLTCDWLKLEQTAFVNGERQPIRCHVLMGKQSPYNLTTSFIVVFLTCLTIRKRSSY